MARKEKKSTKREGMSVRNVTILVMIVVLYFGWGTAAVRYRQSKELWRPGGEEIQELSTQRLTRSRGVAAMGASLVGFTLNSVQQVPRVFSVAAYTFRRQIQIPILVVLIEGLVAGGGYAMWRMEQHMEKTKRGPEDY